MTKTTSLSFSVLTIALIGALLISGCNGSISVDGGLDLDGGDGGGGGGGGDNGSGITQNQLLVVLTIILLVVALVGILR